MSECRLVLVILFIAHCSLNRPLNDSPPSCLLCGRPTQVSWFTCPPGVLYNLALNYVTPTTTTSPPHLPTPVTPFCLHSVDVIMRRSWMLNASAWKKSRESQTHHIALSHLVYSFFKWQKNAALVVRDEPCASKMRESEHEQLDLFVIWHF